MRLDHWTYNGVGMQLSLHFERCNRGVYIRMFDPGDRTRDLLTQVNHDTVQRMIEALTGLISK